MSKRQCRDAVRERWVGTGNRIVGGMLIHTTRREEQECEQTRFENIANICMGGAITLAFGADPVFKPDTESFDPDLASADMLRIYNCSADFGPDAVRSGPVSSSHDVAAIAEFACSRCSRSSAREPPPL